MNNRNLSTLLLILSTIHCILCIEHQLQSSDDWVILRQSTDAYDKDWNDLQRNWHKIKYIQTKNGHYVKRKCSIYFNKHILCLCEYISHTKNNIHHVCFHRDAALFAATYAVMDSFSSLQYDEGDRMIANAIENGMNYYYQSFLKDEELPVDSVFLLKLIAKNDAQYTNIANLYSEALHINNPFSRIFNNSPTITKRFRDLKMMRYNNSYVLNKKYMHFYTDPTDDVVLKALFCDITGYDQMDFDILMNMAQFDGGYFDTHTIISLQLLHVNGCYDKYLIHDAMIKVVNAILISLRKRPVFGDLYFEQIVCLYWAAFGDYVEKQLIVNIAKHQSNLDDGWSHDYSRRQTSEPLIPIAYESEAHPTGLALLAMIYYQIGESKQYFYPVNAL